MDNPYLPPKSTPKEQKEYNVRGACYTDGEAKPVECLQAWISPTDKFYRVKYVPQQSRWKVAAIFTCFVLITIPVGVLGGLGHFILYYLIKTICYSIFSKKVEFDLKGETFLYDREKGILGIRKVQNGEPVFLGCRPRQSTLDDVVGSLEFRDAPLKAGSKFAYQLYILGIAAVGLIGSIIMVFSLR